MPQEPRWHVALGERDRQKLSHLDENRASSDPLKQGQLLLSLNVLSRGWENIWECWWRCHPFGRGHRDAGGVVVVVRLLGVHGWQARGKKSLELQLQLLSGGGNEFCCFPLPLCWDGTEKFRRKGLALPLVMLLFQLELCYLCGSLCY